MRLAVLGGWHLGAVAAGCWPRLGLEVTVWDPDAEIRARLRRGEPPVAEPGLPEALSEALSTGTLAVADTCAEAVSAARVAQLAFDTDVDDEGDFADARLDGAVEAFREHAPGGAVLLVSSQVPVGSCRAWQARVAAESRDLAVACLPENLRLGAAMERFLRPVAPVLGVDDPAVLDRVMPLVERLDATPLVTDTVSAEMIKHARNAYLALCIAFANELGWLAQAAGARVPDVARGLLAEPRAAGAPLVPGAAFSGATLKRDVRALARLGASCGRPELFEAVLEVNRRHDRAAVAWVTDELGPDLSGRTIAILGLAYKPGTSTLRDSQSLRIIRELLERGARCRAFDGRADAPGLDDERFSRAASVADCVAGADAVVVVTHLPELDDGVWGAAEPARRLLIDAAGAVDREAAAAAGWTVRGLT